MKCDPKKHRPGLTLVEVMVVVLIIAVAVIGAMGFRFYCVRDAKLADVQINAARIGSMILENWKGTASPWPYDPEAAFPKATYGTWLIVKKISETDFQIQDSANKVYYDVALSHTSQTFPASNMLSVAVSWRQEYDTSSDPAHTINMTTYSDQF